MTNFKPSFLTHGISYYILWTLIPFVVSQGWDSAELEIFDLVEETSSSIKSFYEYLEISPEAPVSDIRKSYRRLSLLLHPDKNEAEDASLKFRWLASIYEVLKDSHKRNIYDKVLIEGLPNWRSPIFYIRRMRKMGFAEGLFYLLLLLSICQYFVNWAVYWEKKFTLKEQLLAQSKKSLKRSKRLNLEEEVYSREKELLGPSPSFQNTLPFQVFNRSKGLLKGLPSFPSYILESFQSLREERRKAHLQKEKETLFLQRREEEKRERKEQKKQKKQFLLKTKEDLLSPLDSLKSPVYSMNDVSRPRNADTTWSDENVLKLSKLMKKFPRGTFQRWEKIAEILERSTEEVNKMATLLKEQLLDIPLSERGQGVSGTESVKHVSDDLLETNWKIEEEEEDSDDENYGVYILPPAPSLSPKNTKTKTRGKDEYKIKEDERNPSNWSQVEQRALESALITFPKGSSDRWDRISSQVPVKNKEECMLRYKYLSDCLKRKREG